MEPSLLDYEIAKKTYQSYFGREPLKVHPFYDGLGNVVIRLDDSVIRIKKTTDFNLYSKENETLALNLVSSYSIGPKLLSINENNMTLLYRYCEGTNFLSSKIEEKNLEKIAAFINQFHSLPSSGLNPFDAKKHFNTYKIESGISKTTTLETKIRAIVERNILEEKQVFSHNDIVFGNLILNDKNDKLTLIDYEYAGTNNEMFDLASLLSENKIENIHQKTAFLKGYYKKVDNSLLKKCNEFILYEDFLWYYWAVAKYRTEKKSEFLEIADEKEKAISLHRDFANQSF